MYVLLYTETNEYLEKVIYKPFIKYFTTTNLSDAMQFVFMEDAKNYLVKNGLDDADFAIYELL